MAECSRHPGSLLPGCVWCRKGIEPPASAPLPPAPCFGCGGQATHVVVMSAAGWHAWLSCRRCGEAEISNSMGGESGWLLRLEADR